MRERERERERGITGTLHPFKLSLISLSLQSEMTQSQLECLNNFKKYIYAMRDIMIYYHYLFLLFLFSMFFLVIKRVRVELMWLR